MCVIFRLGLGLAHLDRNDFDIIFVGVLDLRVRAVSLGLGHLTYKSHGEVGWVGYRGWVTLACRLPRRYGWKNEGENRGGQP